MKHFLINCALVIVLGLSSKALAETLVIVTSEWAPYVITENGQVTGIHVDIVRELCKRNGIEADIQLRPWKRALAEVKNGDADAIFSPRKTDERAQFLYYPSEPLDMERTVIVGLQGKGLSVTKLDDLEGTSVGVVRGYSYDPEFDTNQEINKDESNDDMMMLRKLAGGRTEFAAASDEGAAQFLSIQLGIQLETIYVLNETPNYIAFSKTLGEKGKVLAEQFGKTLRQLKEEGVIENIRNTYLKTN